MTTNFVSITHGKCVFTGSGCTIAVFVMRCDNSNGRDFPGKVLNEVRGTKSHTPAARDGFNDHGTWTSIQYESQNRTVVCIQVTRNSSMGVQAQGAVFLCLREDASLIKIDARLIPNNNSVYNAVPVFTGKADILSREELPEYGIQLLGNYMSNYMDEEELEEIFAIAEIVKGNQKPEMVSSTAPDGKVVMVPVAGENRRRVRVRNR